MMKKKLYQSIILVNRVSIFLSNVLPLQESIISVYVNNFTIIISLSFVSDNEQLKNRIKLFTIGR